MKDLLILRHAKSDWSDDTIDDKNRILTQRGITEAKNVAKAISNTKIQIDTIISSPAQRALQTATIVKKNINFLQEIKVEECFYFSDMKRILSTIKKIDNTLNTVLLIGHNPLWSKLLYYLSNNQINMDTGCLAILHSQIDKWENIESNSFTQQYYFDPKKIK